MTRYVVLLRGINVGGHKKGSMAELTTLTAAIYRTYRTALEPDMDGAGPGITSRFEVFHDITISNVKVSLGRTPYVDDN